MNDFFFTPYLNFPMNTVEVLEYYQSVFGGELSVMRYTPELIETMGMPVPEGAVAHAQLTGGLVTIGGGDAIFGEPPSLTSDAYAFMLSPESVDEARRLIARLVDDGGEETLHFEEAPWGDHYGQVVDRFGVTWHFDIGPAQAD